MEKHAYMIMAHNNFALLAKLLTLLDDERNDIYLHVDKKAVEWNLEAVNFLFAMLSCYPTNPSAAVGKNGA